MVFVEGQIPSAPGWGLQAAVRPGSPRTEAGPRARRRTWAGGWPRNRPTRLRTGPPGSHGPKPGPHSTASSSSEITPAAPLQGTRLGRA